MSKAFLRVERIADIDVTLLKRVADEVALPEGRVLVLAGIRAIDGERFGECAPRFLLRLLPVYWTRRRSEWDVGIALSAKTCRFSFEHPAFFVYILAHELSHARVVLTNPHLHVYCSFLDKNIRGASNGKVTQYCQLPHEQAHDAYGVWIARRVLGGDRLDSDLSALQSDPSHRDVNRIRFLQEVEPRGDIRDLEDKVRAFARPYATGLSSIWDRELKEATESLVHYAPHIRSFLNGTNEAVRPGE